MNVGSHFSSYLETLCTAFFFKALIPLDRKDESVFSDPTYSVSVLFGKRDEPLLVACARQLIEHIRFASYTIYFCCLVYLHIF